MKIVDIYCPECDYEYDTPEVIPGKPPSCPKCGEVHTRDAAQERALDRLAGCVRVDEPGGFIEDPDGVLERLLFG